MWSGSILDLIKFLALWKKYQLNKKKKKQQMISIKLHDKICKLCKTNFTTKTKCIHFDLITERYIHD